MLEQPVSLRRSTDSTFPDVSSDPEFLKIFTPYFSSEIVEGKHGIVFLRGYQTVVDLKKKKR